MQNDIEKSIASIEKINIFKDVPLKDYTGFKTGGNADYLVAPHGIRSFIETVTILRQHGQKHYILGNGTNVIAPEKQYNGWIIKTDKAFNEIDFASDGKVYCGAGVSLARLCRNCAERGLSGLEFAYGIPGTLGGAVFMNAGAYDGEMKDIINSVKVIDIDGNVLDIDGKDMAFGYRTSAVEKIGYIVIGATLLLSHGDKRRIWARMRELMNSRNEKQPLDYPSCGSTFKRPANGYASKLIDDCGLRGKSVGGAAVSEKHCGFVVNKGGATSEDIFSLIRYIQKTVKEMTGVVLEEEIRVLE